MNYSDKIPQNFQSRFLSLFNAISVFSKEKEEKSDNKLVKILNPFKESLLINLKQYDPNNSGLISFDNLKKLLDSLKIILKENDIEYLLYRMKKFENRDNILDMLFYTDLINLIEKSPEKKTHMIEHEGIKEENAEESDSQSNSEVVITNEEYNEKAENVLSKIAELLQSKGKSVKEQFKEIIFQHEISETEEYESIPLHYLLKELETQGILLDSIGIYCLYTKLKYSDEYEAINVSLLVEEMKNLGIYEKENEISEKFNKNFFIKISQFLKKKKMNLSEILNFDGLISKINLNNKETNVVSKEKFISFLKSNLLISSSNDFNKNLANLFCEGEYVNVSKFEKESVREKNKLEKENDEDIKKKKNEDKNEFLSRRSDKSMSLNEIEKEFEATLVPSKTISTREDQNEENLKYIFTN